MRRRYNKSPEYVRLITSVRWRYIRNKYICAHPLCESCLINGRYEIATEVHHVKPIESATTSEGMATLAYDVNNLRSLCKECHHEAHVLLRSSTKDKRRELKDISVRRFVNKFLK